MKPYVRVEQTGPGRYVVSVDHTWFPGVYESEAAARLAIKESDSDINRLRDSMKSGIITLDAVRGIARGKS